MHNKPNKSIENKNLQTDQTYKQTRDLILYI